MRKMAILSVAALAVLVFVTPLFAGGEKESAAATGDQKVDLLFWTVHASGPEPSAAMSRLVDLFNREHPNINVKHEQVSGQVVYPKFLTAVRGGEMPDVANGYAFHPLQFAAMDQVLPVDDIVAEWEKSGQINDLANEAAYKTFFWNGHYWGVPWELDIRGIYYRKDLLEAKGIKPPTNWDEFRAAVIATNDPANGIYGLSMPAGDFHITQHYYWMFMVQNGGSVIDRNGNLVFGTESRQANVEALRYLTEFHTKYKVTPPGIASYNTDDGETIFVQGKAAFALGRGGLIGRIIQERPDLMDKVGVLDTLQGPKAKLTTAFYAPLFVWKHTEHPEESKTLVKWIAQPGRLETIYASQIGKFWPIWKSDFNMDVWKQAPQLSELNNKVIPYAVGFSYPGGGVPQMGVIDGEKLFAKPVNEVVVGVKTPEQAVQEYHENMAKLWQK